MKHFAIKIVGLVQGVLFRQSAKEMADDLDLFGFIRNEPDGSVYIEVEGEPESIVKFVAWCHEGPDDAIVENIETEEKSLTHFKEFSIQD
jgi:acylphosphatase